MINKDYFLNIFNNFSVFIKKKYKIIIFLFIFIIFLVLIFQYYIYSNNKKNLQLSILYNQTLKNTGAEDFNKKITSIIKEKGFYSILASLNLIKKDINNKNYIAAYENYIKLLENGKLKTIYKSIIALHAAYSLIDFLSTDYIKKLLTYFDESYDSFIGNNLELLYLISIKENDTAKTKELLNIILIDQRISQSIKDRIRKINDFEKYK